MSVSDHFAAPFEAMTGHPPLKWQTRLFKRFATSETSISSRAAGTFACGNAETTRNVSPAGEAWTCDLVAASASAATLTG